MLAFSSVAQVGYIGLGLSLGNMFGFIGAVFHIINHAIMKCCLFWWPEESNGKRENI